MCIIVELLRIVWSCIWNSIGAHYGGAFFGFQKTINNVKGVEEMFPAAICRLGPWRPSLGVVPVVVSISVAV